VLALDIAAEAVRVTHENAAANGVADGIQVAQASLAELLRGDFGPEWSHTPLVVANILASIIAALLEQGLAKVVASGGLLVVAGILDTQAYRIIAALETAGLTVVAQEQIEDWVAILARKS
jgi:ribosomal protein L11 methyltransferase